MAIAKPIRALLFGAMILCTFLFYTIYQTHTGPPLGPGDTIKTYDGTGNDPTGERKLRSNPTFRADADFEQLRMSPRDC